jgi:LacI family transcriptional regulator
LTEKAVRPRICGMSPPPTNVRALARTLGVSPSTVSDALTGKGRVSQSTAARVREAAAAAGYRVNPLTATVLAEIRRKRGSGLRGTIATIDLQESEHWPHGRFPTELVAGARQRAAEMGFSIAEFLVGPQVLPQSRLERILRARGIHGIIVLPSWFQPDLSGIDWSQFAGLYTDYVTARPALHSVSPDHYGSMLALLRLLVSRGYRRPGLMLQRGRDERIQHRQRAAFEAFQHVDSHIEPVPALITPDDPTRAEFVPWCREHQPDVVLGHFIEALDWLDAEYRSHLKPGFVLLNIIEANGRACAGLDLQPRTLGARAAELVVAQILRNERGIPEWPSRTTVEARWVEGPTVRPPE